MYLKQNWNQKITLFLMRRIMNYKVTYREAADYFIALSNETHELISNLR
jgi:hypothetical protein